MRTVLSGAALWKMPQGDDKTDTADTESKKTSDFDNIIRNTGGW